jgi:arginase
MAVSMLTGRCWRALAARAEGFVPVGDSRVLLLGTRDLDPAEQELLEASAVTVAPPATMLATLDETIPRLRGEASGAYVHLDLDVLDASHGRANHFALGGGPSPTIVADALRRIAAALPVRAVTISAFDPGADPSERVARSAISLLDTLLDAVAAREVAQGGAGGARVAHAAPSE